MMTESIMHLLSISLLLLGGAAAGGWALSAKLAGAQAGVSFLYVYLPVASVIMIVQAILGQAGRHRLVCEIASRAWLSLMLIWFLFSLLMPVFWIRTVGIAVKSAAFMGFAVLSIWNVSHGIRDFERKWSPVGAAMFTTEYKAGLSSANWNCLIKSLDLASAVVIPGINESLNAIMSVGLLCSMLVGLSFRNTFPVFSIFAWSMPAAVFAAYFMHAIGSNVGEIAKVKELDAVNT